MAQKFTADGKLGLPLLHLSLLGRRYNQPPVEEFLIAQALLDLKKPDESLPYYQSAVDWLNKAQRPLWACDMVAAGFA